MAGLRIWLDGVVESNDRVEQDRIEVEIESQIVGALEDHPDVTPGATVRAHYHETDDD